MFKIAICDDNPIICSEIEQVLICYNQKKNLNIKMDLFYSGEKLSEKLEKKEQYDLIFLDIQLDLKSGIDIGRIIREKLLDDYTQIIYISAKKNFALELFEFQPLNFLIKPLKREDIIKYFIKAYEISKKMNRDKTHYFEYKINRTMYKVSINDILYFESNGRKVKIITKDRTREFYGKLKDILKELHSHKFYMIHNAYVVNNKHIIKQTYDSVKLSNRVILPISRKHRKKMRQILIEHINQED